ncbi:MAG: nucleoside hydrolase [Christensenellaceae bacterium]
MSYPGLSNEERIARLAPPRGKVKAVLDTDTYNEVDDQFALAYALLSKERFDIDAVYSVPFSATFFEKLLNTNNIGIPMTNDLGAGLEQSHKEIINIFNLLNMDHEGKVFKGSSSYMKTINQPVESEAARDLVARAMESKELLYVISIGEATNVASAILMEPEIIKKIVVVWLAGQPLYWPHAIEFNLGQDVLASQTVLNCGVPLVLVPCMTVASSLTTTTPELNALLNGKSRVGTYLSNIVNSQLNAEAAANMHKLFRLTYCSKLDDYADDVAEIKSESPMAPSRIIWDVSTIGYMVNPNWCPSTLVPTPYLNDKIIWEHDDSRHLMRICKHIYRDGVFGDMFYKLANAPQ